MWGKRAVGSGLAVLALVGTQLGVAPAASAVPVNDDFAQATVIPLGDFWESYEQVTLDATKEPGEPDHAGNPGGASVWFEWTAPIGARWLWLSTSGSTYDTTLALYTGSRVDALSLVASNDDAFRGTVTSALHDVPVQPGETYRIAVDGVGGATGNLQLNFEWLIAAAPNDYFAQAEVLFPPHGSLLACNCECTKEPGEPDHAGVEGGHSIWYALTPAWSGYLAMFTERDSDYYPDGSFYPYSPLEDTLLAVYTGSAVDALTLVAADDDSGYGLTSAVEGVPVLAGETYWIAVDGKYRQWGAFRLTYEIASFGALEVRYDFDGDGNADRAVFRNGAWHIEGQPTQFLGLAGDIPVPGDYDGDGVTEPAVFRDGAWYLGTGDGSPVFWGLPSDIPVPADYNGDGADEPAVWRPSTGAWHILTSGAPRYWGMPGDIPLPADYGGDGIINLAVWRPATGGWFVDGWTTVFRGLPTDVPVPADYDGDSGAEPTVWRPATGGWFGEDATVFLGLPGDVPVPADYDADGEAEPTVWRPATGAWHGPWPPPHFLGLPGDEVVNLPAAIRNLL